MYILIFLAVIFIDQASKYLAFLYLRNIGTFPLFQNILHLTYVENTGAAFGIFQNSQIFLSVISAVFIVVIFIYITYRRPKNRLFLYSLALMAGGAAGNLIDRARLSYVIDFIDFRAINFAVFNVADSAVVSGVILLLYYYIFNKEKVS